MWKNCSEIQQDPVVCDTRNNGWRGVSKRALKLLGRSGGMAKCDQHRWQISGRSCASTNRRVGVLHLNREVGIGDFLHKRFSTSLKVLASQRQHLKHRDVLLTLTLLNFKQSGFQCCQTHFVASKCSIQRMSSQSIDESAFAHDQARLDRTQKLVSTERNEIRAFRNQVTYYRFTLDVDSCQVS